MSGKSRVRWVAAALAAALIAAGAAAWVTGDAGPEGPGPLVVAGSRTESGGSWDVGTTISFGAPSVGNGADRPMTVRKVMLISELSDPGVTVTAVYLADLTDVHEIAAFAVGFPPSSQVHDTFIPAEGAILKPHTNYQVLFVVRVDRPGEWAFPSFEVRYEFDGARYRAVSTEGLRICVPRSVKACGGPK